MNEKTTDKTVYILGAGASVSANLPTQAGLLPLVFSLNESYFPEMTTSADILSLDINTKLQRIQEFYPKFDKYRQKLGAFIVTNFSTSDKAALYNSEINYANSIEESDSESQKQRNISLTRAYDIAKKVNVSLEDLFTIFDSVNSGREHFRLYSSKEMSDIHNQLKLCIIYSLSFSIASGCNCADYELFSHFLFKKRLKASVKDDTMAVITMNWDDVLENTLFRMCDEYNKSLSKKRLQIYPDLCFYNYDLANKKTHIPSTHIKAKGFKNIKILKMHGSLAWLECPKCGRIFTDFSNEIASEEYSEMTCPYCSIDEKTIGLSDNPILRSLIITPTFMKSLDNLNVKNIWHNAFIDVSEASHLVFIGYSFPDADFEMRCMLKKATRNEADVQVVLSKYDNPKYYFNQFKEKGYTNNEANTLVNKMWLSEERYKSFFGDDRITFHYNGFGEYIKSMEVN